MTDAKIIRIAAALRRKFKTPKAAILALGLDPQTFNFDECPPESREINLAYDSHHRRRLGLDADEPRERQAMMKDAVRRACDEAEFDPVSIIEALLESADPNALGEIAEACRAIVADSRGPSGWANDRAERRRLSHDNHVRRPRRFGADNPEPFEGEPLPGGRMRPEERNHRLEEVLSGDRRARAHDLALDANDPLAKLRGVLINQVEGI